MTAAATTLPANDILDPLKSEWLKVRDLPRRDGLQVRVLLTNGESRVAVVRERRDCGGWHLRGIDLASVAGWQYLEPRGAAIAATPIEALCGLIEPFQPLRGLDARHAAEEAVRLVMQERRWHASLAFDAVHDDKHRHAELAQAAVCYLQSSMGAKVMGWPFESPRFRPSLLPVMDLVKAAALCLAELERRLRLPEVDYDAGV